LEEVSFPQSSTDPARSLQAHDTPPRPSNASAESIQRWEGEWRSSRHFRGSPRLFRGSPVLQSGVSGSPGAPRSCGKSLKLPGQSFESFQSRTGMGFPHLWDNNSSLFQLWTINPSAVPGLRAREGTDPLGAAAGAGGSSLTTSFPLRFPARPTAYLVKGFVRTDDHLGFVGSDPNVLGVFGDARMLHRPGGKRRERHEVSYTEHLLLLRQWVPRFSPHRRRLCFGDRFLRFGLGLKKHS